MKTEVTTTAHDFCHIIMNYHGELVINRNVARTENGDVVAIYEPNAK